MKTFLMKNVSFVPLSYSNVLQRFYLPLFITLPAGISAIFCGLLPEKMLHIDGLGLFNMVMYIYTAKYIMNFN